MSKKLFDYVTGNPPYQLESADSESKENGQKPMTNIFQHFQQAADSITGNTSVLIYPGGRWIHQSGKGMKKFGKDQINDKRLSVVKFYPNAKTLFGNAANIPDGITIVVKNHHKTSNGFTYLYSEGSKDEVIKVQAENPGEKLMPLYPYDVPIKQKIDEVMEQYGWKSLNDSKLPRSLFPIESNFVEQNPDKVRPYTSEETVDYKNEIKLLTNDKAGKSGRAKWYVANKNVITKNESYVSEWQVVVSSANAGGQKRDNQLEIIDNHSAFGRSRLALRSFKTEEEALNFYKYVDSYFIRYAFLLTDESLTSLGKAVPDIENYTSEKSVLDFSKNIDSQLCQIFDITEDEFSYIKKRVDDLR